MTPTELEAYDAMTADRDRWRDRAEQLERQSPSGAVSCSAVATLASEVFQHRNWHNLNRAEQLLTAWLENMGYLGKGSQGFTGHACIPNDEGEAPPH